MLSRSYHSSRYFIRRKVLIGLALVFVGIAGASYSSLKLYASSQSEPLNAPTQTVDQQVKPGSKTLSYSEPARLRINKVRIDTSLISLGVKSDGTMEVPTKYDIAGWYKYAPTPGQLGPAIITGHVDSKHGTAVFWRLRELQPGDLIEIDRADGKTVKFKVTSVQQFEQNNFPTNKVYGDTDYAGLRLITCGGTFNRDVGQYSHNTVVFATMVI